MNKSKFTKQLIIGSANFVQKYGVDSRLINKDEIKKILHLAKINNINKIDTADSYLNKSNIFKKIDNKFQFITKINPDKKWISLDYCQKKIQEHFKRFNTNKIHTLLVHDIDVLFRKSGPQIF
jgi:aryl-alcohol dehydrogenase-like predicted oxidoreductase